ncbi:MAG: hypothetical protein J2P17_01050 [Mycobacterium sp.]|nr:hypothetical protein [Mycobacterium sp.]
MNITDWIATSTVVVLVAALVAFVVIDDTRYQRPAMPHHRYGRERSQLWLHDTPTTPPTTERAHRDMQLHVDCLIDECPRKRAAYKALVAAGHLTPETR